MELRKSKPHGAALQWVQAAADTDLHRDMDEVVLDIKQWGNNLGVRLPATTARAARLRVHQRVRLSVQESQVLNTRLDDAPLALAQRLARFDHYRHGGKSMTPESTPGAERW